MPKERRPLRVAMRLLRAFWFKGHTAPPGTIILVDAGRSATWLEEYGWAEPIPNSVRQAASWTDTLDISNDPWLCYNLASPGETYFDPVWKRDVTRVSMDAATDGMIITKTVSTDGELGIRTVRLSMSSGGDGPPDAELLNAYRVALRASTIPSRLVDLRRSLKALLGLNEYESAKTLVDELAALVATRLGPEGQHTAETAAKAKRIDAEFRALWQQGQRRKELRSARDGQRQGGHQSAQVRAVGAVDKEQVIAYCEGLAANTPKHKIASTAAAQFQIGAARVRQILSKAKTK